MVLMGLLVLLGTVITRNSSSIVISILIVMGIIILFEITVDVTTREYNTCTSKILIVNRNTSTSTGINHTFGAIWSYEY